MTLRRVLLLVLAVVAFSSAGCRPRVPLPVGGQPRFTDLGDGTVRDTATALVWTRSGNLVASAGTFDGPTWAEALGIVAEMNAGRRANFGHTDWRVPRVEEQLSLFGAFWAPGSAMACFGDDLDPGCRFRVPFDPFTDVMESGYWSGTNATGAFWREGRGTYVPSAPSPGGGAPDAWAVDTRAQPFPVTKTARGSLWPVRGTATAVGVYREPVKAPAGTESQPIAPIVVPIPH